MELNFIVSKLSETTVYCIGLRRNTRPPWPTIWIAGIFWKWGNSEQKQWEIMWNVTFTFIFWKQWKIEQCTKNVTAIHLVLFPLPSILLNFWGNTLTTFSTLRSWREEIWIINLSCMIIKIGKLILRVWRWGLVFLLQQPTSKLKTRYSLSKFVTVYYKLRNSTSKLW